MKRQGERAQGSAPMAAGRLIILALAGGVLMFGVVAVAIGPLKTEGDLQLEHVYLPLFLAVLAPGVFMASALFAANGSKRLKDKLPEAKVQAKEGLIPQALIGSWIMGAACFESLGLLAGIVLLLGGHWSGYAGIVIGLIGILSHLPTSEKVERAIQHAG